MAKALVFRSTGRGVRLISPNQEGAFREALEILGAELVEAPVETSKSDKKCNCDCDQCADQGPHKRKHCGVPLSGCHE